MSLSRIFKQILRLNFVSWKSAFAVLIVKYAVSSSVLHHLDWIISSWDTNVSHKLLRLDRRLRIYLPATWSFAGLDSPAITPGVSPVEAAIRIFVPPEIILSTASKACTAL